MSDLMHSKRFCIRLRAAEYSFWHAAFSLYLARPYVCNRYLPSGFAAEGMPELTFSSLAEAVHFFSSSRPSFYVLHQRYTYS